MLRSAVSSKYLVPTLTVVAIIALFLSAVAVAKFTQVGHQREADRVADDLASCERGNDLRRQIITLADATEALPQEILDLLSAALSDEDGSTEIADLTQPAFDRFEAAVEAIQTIDCDQLVHEDESP